MDAVGTSIKSWPKWFTEFPNLKLVHTNKENEGSGWNNVFKILQNRNPAAYPKGQKMAPPGYIIPGVYGSLKWTGI